MAHLLDVPQTARQAADPMRSEPYRIERVRRETSDTFTFDLVPVHDSPPLRFAPGQFNMLYVFGVGEVPISISGDSAQPEVLVHTTREVGTVTRAMLALKGGDVVGVRGPYGSVWPVEAAEGRDLVLVAGGIGLAPLRPALYHALANRERYGKVVLLYGARTPEDILYKDELMEWHSRFDLDVLITVDRATGSWQGGVGLVTTLMKRAPFDPQSTVAMLCGPEVMMRFSALELMKRGVADSSIYVSLERNMKCAIGFCGHCQFGAHFVCKDGPVFAYDHVQRLMTLPEV